MHWLSCFHPLAAYPRFAHCNNQHRRRRSISTGDSTSRNLRARDSDVQRDTKFQEVKGLQTRLILVLTRLIIGMVSRRRSTMPQTLFALPSHIHASWALSRNAVAKCGWVNVSSLIFPSLCIQPPLNLQHLQANGIAQARISSNLLGTTMKRARHKGSKSLSTSCSLTCSREAK